MQVEQEYIKLFEKNRNEFFKVWEIFDDIYERSGYCVGYFYSDTPPFSCSQRGGLCKNPCGDIIESEKENIDKIEDGIKQFKDFKFGDLKSVYYDKETSSLSISFMSPDDLKEPKGNLVLNFTFQCFKGDAYFEDYSDMKIIKLESNRAKCFLHYWWNG
jgi:hypothetical protein